MERDEYAEFIASVILRYEHRDLTILLAIMEYAKV